MSNNQRGYTLAEIMVALSILTLIFVIGSEFVVRGFRSLTFGSEQETAVQNARRAMEIIAPEMREAEFSERGDYPLALTDEQEFSFYSDVDGDNEAEKVRYYLDNTRLNKSVTEPGPSQDYSGTGQISKISDYINNQSEPLFQYFDSKNATSTTINEIKMVKTILKVNVNPAIAPQDYYVETNTQLRNLKDN